MSKRRQFTAEFKDRAVSLALNPGLTQTQVCAELGVSQSLLSRWIRERKAQLEGSDESTRIQQLERLVAQKDLEISFLKKAASYFARTTDSNIS